MSILKKVAVAVVVIAVLCISAILYIDYALTGLAEAVDSGYQEQRFEDMIERDRLEGVRCSKMSKKQKRAEMCP